MSLSTQVVELIIVLYTLNQFRYAFPRVKSALVHAQAKSGSVRQDTVPTRLWGTPFLILQAVICHLPTTIYIIAVVCGGLKQPSWMDMFALPEVVLGIRVTGTQKNLLRLLTCVLGLVTKSLADSAFEHLSDQYHPIGRREKPRVVQTGPYAWVRHPLYSLALLGAAIQAITFWSYIPLFAFVAIAIVFSIKINIEEEIIQRDEGIRGEYRAYMRKVPARLIPYVW